MKRSAAPGSDLCKEEVPLPLTYNAMWKSSRARIFMTAKVLASTMQGSDNNLAARLARS